MVVTREF